MANVTRTVVLTGARAGQTCKLNHGRFHFTDGKLVLRGDGAKVAALMKILADQYQAYEIGSEELEAANGKRDLSEAGAEPEPVLGGVQPRGEGPAEEEAVDGGGPGSADADPGAARSDPEGNGHPDPRMEGIQVALGKLDHGKEDHWTRDGFPKVSVVKRLTKDDTITRRDIKKAAPDFQREG